MKINLERALGDMFSNSLSVDLSHSMICRA